MKSYVIVLYSYTAARKAAHRLKSLGIGSAVEKVSSYKGGCGYGLRVTESPEKICGILSAVGIRCKGIISGG